jgi:type IV pilus assembly protein PilW
MYASNTSTTKRHRQGGFTLVELMVSMVISLLVALAALGSVQFFMGMQRQTTGISGSLANANTAFSALKFEVAQAGLGFFNKGKLACNTFNVSKGTAATVAGQPLLPASISMTGATPTLNLFYATAIESAGAADLASTSTNAPDGTAKLSTYLPVSEGQEVLLVSNVPGTPCSLRTVTGVDDSSGSGQVLTFGASGLRNQYAFSPVSYVKDDNILLTGKLQSTTFTVDANNQFVMTRPLEGTSAVLAKNVVAAVMQYGVADSGGNTITGWRYPKAYPNLETGPEDWEALSAAVLADRVKAIKVSLLVRSAQKDKKTDGQCSTTENIPTLLGVSMGGTVDPASGMLATDKVTDALTGDWKCYRYAEIGVVIPLRNLIVGKNT